MSAYRRLVIAANRLPFAVATGRGRLELRPTTGGLASALSAVHQQGNNVWVGWPGDCSGLDAASSAELDETFARHRVIPVSLNGREIIDYYDGVCNAALWPVLHYQIDRLPLTLPPFEPYRAVNERFADALVAEHRPGDMIWIHDYHLMLVPAMVRRRIPHAQVGFFLHTPFPSVDVFRVLPWRRELLDGVLGSTVVGFQTANDAANFTATLTAVTGHAVDKSGAIADGRRVDIGTYPIGIDTERLQDGGRPSRRFARSGCRLFVGVDRLDYTKGIPLRLTAFERLLVANPALRGTVQLLQVAVPSREHLPSYASLKREVEALIARVNVRFGTPAWTPIRYFPEALPPDDLAALYRAADVMLVTSLRDGMNLVSKEFVSTRQDEDGVLVLSELTGAAGELEGAVTVNPYSVDELVSAMTRALDMDREERRERMSALRLRTKGHTVHNWVDRFTGDVQAAADGCLHRPSAAASTVRASIESGNQIALALPFEGVLVQDATDALRSGPDPEVLQLLLDLTMRPGITVHVLSGFDHHAMEPWFDAVPAIIWAEHGLWHREAEGRRWRRTQWTTSEWRDDVEQLLEQFVAATPGAYLERRQNALAWRFHRADPTAGQSQAQTLAALLREAAEALGYHVTTAPGLVEVRSAGLTVARTVQKMIEMDQTHQVVFVGGFNDAASVAEVLRPADILIDFTGEPSPRDARRTRRLLRELVDSLVHAARTGVPLPTRLRNARYLPAGLHAAVANDLRLAGQD
jgi:trehalose 6-phosphate synthase/phosphatase